MKNICLGILAHVDAGKTSLCESLLYKSSTIRTAGRVDTKDSFLDTNNDIFKDSHNKNREIEYTIGRHAGAR